MKFKRKYILTRVAAILFAVVLINISGCVKKDPIGRITQVLFVPLSPNTSSVDFSVNGNLFATTVPYSTTTGTLRYAFPYYTMEPKNGSIISYNITGTNTPYASVTKDLEENKVYSTFLIDSLVRIKAVVVNDNLTAPTLGKVKIRFFHFSVNTSALDVVNSATSTNMFSNRSFNDQASNPSYENFIEIDPGNYTFIFKNITTGAVIYTTTAQALLTDRIYTLAIRGFNGGTGTQAIGGFVYANKP